MSRYTLLTSVLNRATGLVLSAGLVLLVYWLTAVASGNAAYQAARRVLSLGLLEAVYVGLLAAFSYHLFAGIRHLIWDTGHGLERGPARRSAWLVALASVLLFLALAWCALRSAGSLR
jgi:succinate dehydrogenase / fumarate reductase cytochrome b subunit